MTHLATIKALTELADEARQNATSARRAASLARGSAAEHEADAERFDREAAAFEDSIDALHIAAQIPRDIKIDVPEIEATA